MIPSTEILLLKIIHTAVKAGNEILYIYRKNNFTVDFKADSSPLTDADCRSHDIICDELRIFKIPVLSEESEIPDYDIRKNYEYMWLVDPLDGTKEFISRNGEFTVNIALIRNGKPLMGVVYAPVSGELYFADETYGSYKCSTPSEINSTMNLEEIISLCIKLPVKRNDDKFIVVASRSHMNSETHKYIGALKTEKKEIELVSKGSSLKLCMVAEGAADIYPRIGRTMEWDIAAGHAIALYAGKDVREVDAEKSLSYNKQDLSNPFFILM